MRTNKGYTLIEILIALVVFAIVMTIITSALFNIYNTQLSLTQQQQNLFALQKTMMIMERDFEQAINRKSANESAVRFNPSQRQAPLHFTTIAFSSLPVETPFIQLSRVSYFINNNQLIRQTETNKQVLLNNVTQIQWRFFDEKQRSYALWPPVQQMSAMIPRGIAVQLTFSGGPQLERTFLLPHFQFQKKVPDEKA